MFGIIAKAGRYLENYQETFYLAAGITAADIGKAVTIDATGDKKVKLAGDGDRIFGRLEVVEPRTQEGVLVGTVSMKFIGWVPIKAGLTSTDVVNVGDSVTGAGAGEVKALATSVAGNYVGFVDATKGALVYFI